MPLDFTATLFQSGIYHGQPATATSRHLCSDQSRTQVETFCSQRANGASAYMLENTHFKNSLLATSKNTAQCLNHRFCSYSILDTPVKWMLSTIYMSVLKTC
jgi:hypothetical protein